ncbi:MAG: peptide chain release factor N(5)-glutamine methyltransferase [Candidatus Omnitrophica bacterium]|nr:peptide chain release factor N(5)-glutamine methyltransferase [Candidatus Omnitrophota bacterium]MCM8798103.1 peptide chain release factor N(5)-glutamine methyltransferase [Candidatus Omnitrophota bacterium]
MKTGKIEKIKLVSSTIGEYINWAIHYLEEHGVENPRVNAEELFSLVSGKKRFQIYLERETEVGEEMGEEFISLVKKRAEEGYPLQYIIKNTEFYGLFFIVLPGVFIPRPETEILVETVISIIERLNGKMVKLLDIGTGSGCIAISLAKFISNVKIIATDISPFALKIARRNAWLNKTEDKIEFVQADLFPPSTFYISQFEIIVSNPPYIPNSERESLPREVKFEPPLSWDGGENGLFYIEKIIREAPRYLREEGALVMEIGFGQKKSIENIFSQSQFNKLNFVKDYRGIERVAVLGR